MGILIDIPRFGDPNEFLTASGWANTVHRWSTNLAHISPNDMEPAIPADENDNVIYLRVNADDPDFLEVEMDGAVTDMLPYEVLGQVRINAGAGADRIIIDYVNGDPTPERGFLIDGGPGADVIQFENDLENLFDVTNSGAGIINETTEFIDIEELVGGTAMTRS